MSLQIVAKRAWCYFMLTCMTYIAVITFLWQLSLLPIFYVSPTIYRKLSTWLSYVARPAFLCVHFSWANCRIFTNGLAHMYKACGHDQLIITNHSSRIDWLFATYMTQYFGQREGFCTESFLLWLPFVGWHRYLVGDMFVYRSFKQDRDRLLKNINDFKNSNIKRWIYLCPEGHIADFNNIDKKYIEDCSEFCESNGFEPFKMLLTPRYKGMQVFTKLCPQNENGDAIVRQGTMTYVQNGNRLVKPLTNNQRVIPDLWTALYGGLECFAHCHLLYLSEDPQVMKKQLMKDYSLQDKSLYEFYQTGRFPLAYPGKTVEDSPEEWKPYPLKGVPLLPQAEMDQLTGANDPLLDRSKINSDYQEIPKNHLEMNLSFFFQVLLSFWIFHILGLSSYIVPGISLLYFSLVVCHLIGENLANGQSRESLPFEGAIKAVMFRWYGVE